MNKEGAPKKSLNLYQRILKIMEDVSYIQKGTKKVNGQYGFVSHDQVAAAIQPLLTKHGVVVVPHVGCCKQVGNRTEIELEVFFINSAQPDERFKITAIGYGVDNSDKGPGKAVSYAYKYSLLKMFCLSTGDDPEKDVTTEFKEPEEEKIEPTLTNDQISTLRALLRNDEALTDRIFKKYEVKNFDEIKADSFSKIVAGLKKIRECS